MGGARRGNNPELVFWEDTLVGINLGWDHCAEHEWGIKGIQSAFGVPTHEEAGDTFGIDRRKSTRVPEGLLWYDSDDGDGFVYDSWLEDENNRPDWTFSSETRLYRDDTMGAAWGDSSFQVKSIKDEEKDALTEIFNALREKNVVIALMGSNNPFSNSGLSIFIADRLPQEVLDKWYNADKETYELEQEWERATVGLEDKLREAGLRHFFLGNPKLISRGDEEEPVLRAWLNPMEQRKYKAGWFTAEELFAWAKDPDNSPVTISSNGS